MKIPDHPTLIRRMLDSRLRQMQAHSPLLIASLVEIARSCGKPGCACQEGKKHVGRYLTFKEKGKTRTVYVPRDLESEVRTWVQEHQRLRHLSQEISQLAVAQIRSHVRTKRRRAGRT